jgi:hypothetical protein
MSFWVNRMNTVDYDENPVGGAFTFGGTNTSLYQGAIEYLPTTAPSNTTWNLDVKGACFNAAKFCTLSHSFIHSLSQRLSYREQQCKSPQPQLHFPSCRSTFRAPLRMSRQYGPPFQTPSLVQPIPDIMNFVRLYRVPFSLSSNTNRSKACTTNVNVSVSFGGLSWNINPVDMNIGAVQLGSSNCLGAIYALNSSSSSNTTQTNGTTSWVFGTAFMVSSIALLLSLPAE